ncbi:hypothetical protein SDC9_45388 [bioreactor metagenome]|uniref:Glycosyltransferase RgtA/B/C/D-like domain-containing protein n=1 Tax=bioreactor metagenome TaxID=1076179 RepID=A0A644W9D9_9ZZZZ
MKKHIIRWSFHAFLMIAAYLILSNLVFFPHQIICYDVYGYYLYLPQTFIYHDLSMNNPDQVFALLNQYGSSSTFYQASLLPDGTYVMKYSMGMTILYAPFFFVAHLVAPLIGYAADGYSYPYQLALLLGGILYAIAGMWFLRKVLLKFFDEKITAITLLIIVAGTNLPVHTAMYGQNAMSHNYLFALYAMALWFTIKWHESFRLKWIVLLAIVSGIAILSRPTEIVILLIPLLWNIVSKVDFKKKNQLLKKQWTHVVLFSGIIFLIGSFQLIYWKLHTGHFIYYSYKSNPGEGMDLLNPHIAQLLFSFRKGWIIYTPIILFAFAGFYTMYYGNRKIFGALLAYTIVNLYFISCWSTWWYAQSFSQRPLVPALAVMSIPLGYFFQWLLQQKLFVKAVFSTIFLFLIFLNIFQIWQFDAGILDGERMTEKYYERIFLKTSVAPEDRDLLLLDRWYFEQNGFVNEQDYSRKLFKSESFENGETIDSITPVNGKKYCILDSSNSYSKAIEIPYSEITQKDHAWLRIRVSVFPVAPVDSLHIALVAHFSYKGRAYCYKTLESPELVLRPDVWNELQFDYLTPEVRRKRDPFITYIWNMKGGRILVDNLSVEVFEKN